jgi:hypothetical protein
VAMEKKLQDKLEVLVDRDKARELETMTTGFVIATNGKGGAFIAEFEDHAKVLMATGASGNSCRDQLRMDAAFFWGEEAAAKLEFPKVFWFTCGFLCVCPTPPPPPRACRG